MRIYLARHAQTISNRKRFILGRDDSPLTRAGRESLAVLAGLLAGAGIAGIYHSPLGRAQSSAAILGAALGLPVTELDDLIDLASGQFEGKSRKVFLCPGDRLRPSWREAPAAGESYADGEERAARALAFLAARAQAAAVLAVGHLALNRVILKQYCGVSEEAALAVGQPLDAVYVLENGRAGWFDARGGKGEGFLPYQCE